MSYFRTEPITTCDDIIDSRDVIARIEWLVDDENLTSDEIEELAALEALAKEAEGYAGDWLHGEALINEGYFDEYAKQLADDIGAVDPNATWPMTHIDWEAAADELKQDYTTVDFDGTDYLVR